VQSLPAKFGAPVVRSCHSVLCVARFLTENPSNDDITDTTQKGQQPLTESVVRKD